MATYDMGFFLRQIRCDRGITQTQLCKGLCATSTLSKIERGLYTPPSYLFRALMERLGNYYGKYFCDFLDKDDYERWKVMQSIDNELIKNNIEQVEKLIAKHMDTNGFKEGFGLQYIINCKLSLAIVKLGKAKANNLNVWEAIDISYEEWLSMSYESIKITIPDFDESKINDYMLTFEEARAILNLAGAFYYNKEYEKAAPILLEMILSMDKYCPDKKELFKIYPVILYNLADTMYEMKKYDETIFACELGRHFCVEYSRAREIPYFMSLQSKSLIEKGDTEDGRILLYQTYFVSLSLEQKDTAESINKYYLEVFGTNILF